MQLKSNNTSILNYSQAMQDLESVAKTTVQQPIICKLFSMRVACRYFLSGSHDSTVTVWDVKTLMPIKTHCNYDAAINDASFSHDSQLLALGGEEQTIKINHTFTGQHVACLFNCDLKQGVLCQLQVEGAGFVTFCFCRVAKNSICTVANKKGLHGFSAIGTVYYSHCGLADRKRWILVCAVYKGNLGHKCQSEAFA